MVVHVVGGGLAGLSAAVECAARGLKVRLYEAAPRLGGRCASWFDADFGAVLDNGTHVVVGANRRTMQFLRRIGSRGPLVASSLQMIDLRSGQPFSPFSGLGLADLAAAFSLLLARPGLTAEQVVGNRPSAATFWEPLCTAALNTPLAQADARLLGGTLRRMAFSLTPLLAATSLAETYVTPAEVFIRAHGGDIVLSSAITSLVRLGDRITALGSRESTYAVGRDDQVVIALPAWSPLLAESGLAPEAADASPIVNAHFEVPSRGTPRFTGLIGGTGQWLLHRGTVATVTVSAANDLTDRDESAIAALLWHDVARHFQMSEMPRYRVIKERRATLLHSPESQNQRRLSPPSMANAVLAGDWTHAALPCTVEAAITSGVAAASAVRMMS